MIYRILGSSAIKVSAVGIGTHRFGGEWGDAFSPSQVAAILGRGRDLGINLIDTAPSYGNHASERLIGKGIGGRRADWVIATKFGNRFDPERGESVADFSVSHVKAQLEASLKALRTDYVDVYQFHSGDNAAFDNAALWCFLQEEVAKGTIRALGLSIKHDLVRAGDLYQLEEAGAHGISCVQVLYNRLVPEAGESVLPFCEREGLGAVARVPLARGLLSGRYEPGHRFDPKDYRARFGEAMNARLLKEADRIRREEVPEDASMAQWALAWCLRNPAVTCVIPGCRDVAQLESNARAVELLKLGEAR